MFPKYHVLANILKNHRLNNSLHDYYIVSVQHLLRSTGSMFEAIISYGFLPHHIFLTGKIYSTHQETFEKLGQLGINTFQSSVHRDLGYYVQSLETDIAEMWRALGQVLKLGAKIIILDDGGYTLKNTPASIVVKYEVYGIEQTTSGIKMQSIFGKFPVIHLASSAAKVVIEPKIVSEAIQLKLGEIIASVGAMNVGLVGYGNIGKAIVNDLRYRYNVFVYDIKNEMENVVFNNVKYCNSMDEIIYQTDIIIGATGQDISNMGWLNSIEKDTMLISVSSGDIEFNSLLKNSKAYLKQPTNSVLDDLYIKTLNGSTIKVLRGGMVANFTGQADSSPGHIIQITRGLLLAAIIQIVEGRERLEGQTGPIMLSPLLQKEVTSYWLCDQPQRKVDYTNACIEGFNNLEWIANNSGGKYLH